jgi:hypothetical protein
MSGTAGAPEQKGLNLYGCVVAGGARRGHRLFPCTSCRRTGCPGREVRAAGFRQLLRGARSGCRVAQVTARLPPGSVVAGGGRALSGGLVPGARRTNSRGRPVRPDRQPGPNRPVHKHPGRQRPLFGMHERTSPPPDVRGHEKVPGPCVWQHTDHPSGRDSRRTPGQPSCRLYRRVRAHPEPRQRSQPVPGDAPRVLPGRPPVQPQGRHLAKSLTHGRSCRS